MPSPAQRLVASTAKRTFAVFDCPYAPKGVVLAEGVVVEVVEDHRGTAGDRWS